MRTPSTDAARTWAQVFPWKRRLELPFNRTLRRAYRLFRAFPAAPCRCMVDIGAHAGSFTDLALEFFRPELVCLVEADPELAQRLRQKYARQPRCRVLHAAIAATSGSVSLRLNQDRASSSLLPLDPTAATRFQKDLQEVGAIAVPALRLDDLFRQERLDRVDLLKVDIQGAERLLVEGGQAALLQVRSVFIEVLFEESYTGAALFSELHLLLQKAGFKLHSLHELRRNQAGHLLYANALYRNAKMEG